MLGDFACFDGNSSAVQDPLKKVREVRLSSRAIMGNGAVMLSSPVLAKQVVQSGAGGTAHCPHEDSWLREHRWAGDCSECSPFSYDYLIALQTDF